MRTRPTIMRTKKQIESILLICILVATSMVIVFPLTAPRVKAQVIHLSSASAEDGIFPYDMDGKADGIVHWDPAEDHWIMDNYTVELGFTLDIPALDSIMGHEISFHNGSQRIDVWGKLLTNPGNLFPPTMTLFRGAGGTSWEGIIFHPGSEGNIQYCYFTGAERAVRFFPAQPPFLPDASKMLYPGIYRSTFTNMGKYGVQLVGTTGYRNVEFCTFQDTYDSAISLDVDSTEVNIKNSTFFSHDDNKPSLRVINTFASSNAYVENSYFWGNGQLGNEVYIGKDTNATVLDQCTFQDGSPGDHFIQVEGSSPFIDNCSFDTAGGELSLVANEYYTGIPAHPIIRNPNPSAPFDNTTINATGNSSITLQWFMDVHVTDPLDHSIEGAPVWIKDRNGNPAEPSSKVTEGSGWARWFTVIELTQYNGSIVYYSPFNTSATNNSMMGYAYPEPTMNMSKAVNVTVPFNPIPNIQPKVSWLPTPFEVQSGNITIDFMLEDPNPGDDGNMSIIGEYSTDSISWQRATAAPGSDLDHLYNNTLYHFVWDSKVDLGPLYSTTVYIRITPVDRAGNGTKNQTGNFTVDNAPPVIISGPGADTTNSTAIINWTVDESADASVRYGLDGILTDQASGSTGSPFQSVALSNLQQGRRYSYIVVSTDRFGNQFSSPIFIFETKVHIQLYMGWNMISIPAKPNDPSLEIVLNSIIGQYDAVQWYNPEDPADQWKHNRPGKPFGNDLDMIEPRMGLWVHMINNAVLIPDLIIQDPGFFEFVPLSKGWNFVGYPSVTTRDVTTALAGVPYDMVQTYDAATGQWISYDPNTGSGDLTEMDLGRGYWVHATASDIWEVYYV